jgi:DNA-binding SARP family transcriptional activator
VPHKSPNTEPLPTLQLHGAASLWLGDVRVLSLERRDAALLAYLAFEGPTLRVKLLALLWPDEDAVLVRGRLRQRLFALKRKIKVELVLGNDALRLNDAARVLSGGGLDDAAARPLLGDDDYADIPEFARWLVAQRQRERAHRREHFAEQASTLEGEGRLAEAIVAAERLLAEEPLLEHAHRRLMRLHYLRGDRAAALRSFDQCEQLLRHELSAHPSEETQALLAIIERGPASGVGVRRAVPASVLRPPRMVGRERELVQLQAARDAGHVAAIIGEAGMGKTRLLHDFMQQHAGIVRVAGRPGDAGVPFATLARLLRAVAEQHPQSQPLVEAIRHEIARVLPELGGSIAKPSEHQRLPMRRALIGFLNAAQGLQGLAVDDMHFADAASLEMLQSLIDEAEHEGAELRWILAFRPAEAGTPLLALQRALSEAARLVPIAVQALDLATLAALVDDLALPGVQGARLAPLLLQRTGGNPLFVLETLKQAWVEQRMDQLGSGVELPRPMSVERLIDLRIGQLSPGAMALARVASIAGEDFSIPLAEAVLEVNVLQLADSLHELEVGQVLRGTQFAHDLVFDALLRSVPQAIAVQVHGKVAQWLEHKQGEPARIARHWLAAQQSVLALPWLEQAAARAWAALRTTEYLAFVDQRADVEESLGRRDEAFESRHRALASFASHQREAEEGHARCDALDRLAGNDEQRCRAALARAGLAQLRGEADSAEACGRRALGLARQCGSVQLMQQSQISVFVTLTSADRTGEATTLGEDCLAWIDDHPDLQTRKELHGALAVLYDNTGRLQKGLEQHQKALHLCEHEGDLAGQATVTANISVNRSYAGQIKRSVALNLDCLRIRAQADSPSADNCFAYANLADLCGLLGHYSEALAWADQAEPLMRNGMPSGLPVLDSFLAGCWIHLWQTGRAHQSLNAIASHAAAGTTAKSRRHLLASQLSRMQGLAHREHAEAGLAVLATDARENTKQLLMIEMALSLPAEAALHALAEAREQAKLHEYGGHVLETHVRAAQVALAINPPLAAEHARRALELAETFDLVASYPGELWLHAGQALIADGDVTRGATVLQAGHDWLMATARDHVPEPFRSTFLHRHPINAQLLALAQQKSPKRSLP